MRQDTTLHGVGFMTPSIQGGALSSSARSHLGHVRLVNEDRILHRPDRGLWAVADGMGGYHDGDIAADIVVGSLNDLADHAPDIQGELICQALNEANAAIFRHGSKIGSVIGSTAVVLHIEGSLATIFWVGDSRAYLVRGEVAEQITQDHSVVQELLSAGLITPEQAAVHPNANTITRAIGIGEDVEIDKVSLTAASGDVLFLCSDGFSRSLTPNGLADACWESPDTILQDALRRDASDNVSFVKVTIPSL